MCTVSIIPWSGGVRLVINRDELRTRAAGERPRVVEIRGGRRGLWPVDPLGGGTWVGAHDAGLVMAILNGNPKPRPEPPRDPISRGVLIPDLMRCDDAGGVMTSLSRTDLDRFASFRLVAADARRVMDAYWDRSSLTIRERGVEPVCFVSSGLGDGCVEPRLELFESMMRDRGVTAAVQDAFHGHAWGDRPEISVMMSRDDARTVSVTRVESGLSGAVVMHHSDDDGTVRVELSRAGFMSGIDPGLGARRERKAC